MLKSVEVVPTKLSLRSGVLMRDNHCSAFATREKVMGIEAIPLNGCMCQNRE